MPTQIFDIFLQCYQAIRGGELIKRQSVTDKEFGSFGTQGVDILVKRKT